MAIAKAGEHVKEPSKEFRESEFGGPWRGVSGMRDWIIRDDGLDFDRLYYSVIHEIPQVLAILHPYVGRQSRTPLTTKNPFDVPRIWRNNREFLF